MTDIPEHSPENQPQDYQQLKEKIANLRVLETTLSPDEIKIKKNELIDDVENTVSKLRTELMQKINYEAILALDPEDPEGLPVYKYLFQMALPDIYTASLPTTSEIDQRYEDRVTDFTRLAFMKEELTNKNLLLENKPAFPTEEALVEAQKIIEHSQDIANQIQAYAVFRLPNGEYIDNKYCMEPEILFRLRIQPRNNHLNIPNNLLDNPYATVAIASAIKYDVKKFEDSTGLPIELGTEISPEEFIRLQKTLDDAHTIATFLYDMDKDLSESSPIYTYYINLLIARSFTRAEDYDVNKINPRVLSVLSKRISEHSLAESDTDINQQKDLLKNTPQLIQEVREYMDLAFKYKGQWQAGLTALRVISEQDSMYRINELLKQNDGDFPNWLLDNPQLVLFTSNKLKENIAQLKQQGIIHQDSEYLATLEKKNVTRLDFDITGDFNEDKGYRTVFDNPQGAIEQFLTRQDARFVIPQYFFDNLTSIHFSSEADLYKVFDIKNKVDWARGSMLLRLKISETLLHEVFEHVVTKLTIDDLKGWEKASDEDGVSISMYEKITLFEQSDASDEIKAFARKEGFCDAGAMFYTNPTALKIANPNRYQFMLNFWSKHLPEEKRQEFRNTYEFETNDNIAQIQQQNALDEAKKQLLVHETIDKQTYVESKEKAVKAGENINVTLGYYKVQEVNTDGTVKGFITIAIKPQIPLENIK